MKLWTKFADAVNAVITGPKSPWTAKFSYHSGETKPSSNNHLYLGQQLKVREKDDLVTVTTSSVYMYPISFVGPVLMRNSFNPVYADPKEETLATLPKEEAMEWLDQFVAQIAMKADERNSYDRWKARIVSPQPVTEVAVAPVWPY